MRYVKIEGGVIVAGPQAKPANVTLGTGAVVGSAHWQDGELKVFGWHPVAGGAAAYQRETGVEWDAETEIATVTVEQVPIGELRAGAKATIDAAAEAARSRFVTSGSGQAMTYQRKLEEARLHADGAPGPFPILEASIGADGVNLAAVAAVVLATADAWAGIAAQIEGLRLGAKRAVDQASDGAAIAAIVGNIEWPSP